MCTARHVIPILALTCLAAAPGSAAGRPRPRISAPRQASVKPRPVPPLEDLKAALEIPGLKTQEQAADVVGALLRLPGVKSALIDLKTCLAVVDYRPGTAGLPQILGACRAAGFEASEYRVEVRFPKPIRLKGG